MSKIIHRQLAVLAETISELKQRVRIAVAGELGQALYLLREGLTHSEGLGLHRIPESNSKGFGNGLVYDCFER